MSNLCGKVSMGIEEVLPRTEEKERHKEGSDSYYKESAQGNMLLLTRKEKEKTKEIIGAMALKLKVLIADKAID